MGPLGMPWHAMGRTLATPAANATALHGNLTSWHGSPHGTPMSTSPRVRVRVRVWVRVRVPWYAVEIRGRFRGLPGEMP